MKFPVPLGQMLPLLGITVSAFVFNTSEFMPIALLMDISHSFAQTEAETGIMITVYAWMVAILSLPLMMLAGRLSPKPLLLLTLSVFALGQVVSGLAPTFPALMGGRIVVASAHAIFWSVAAPLAARLVDKGKSPFALSMVATGTAVAMVFGLPLGRVIGLALGWRMTFLSIAFVTALALVYLFFVFPKMENGESFTLGDLPALFKNPAITSIFVMTLFFATSYFTTYSYIEPFLHGVAHFSAEGITAALMLVGASGFLGSFVFSKMFNTYPHAIILTGVLYKDISFRIEKTGLALGVVYSVLALTVAPSIMLNHSGKEVGEALAHMDTTGKTIAFLDTYRTSAVFYSGKTIYRAVEGDKIESMEPGTLSWNAKNVMPFIPEEKLANDPNAILITRDNDRSPFLIAYNEDLDSYRINVSGEYSLWIR